MYREQSVVVRSLERSAAYARAGFLLLWILCGILTGCVALWLLSHGDSVACRAESGLRELCEAARSDLDRIETARAASPDPGSDPPRHYLYWSSWCNSEAIDRWIREPCRPWDTYTVGARRLSCPEAKNHALALRSDLRLAPAASVVQEGVEIPLVGLRISVIDFVLVAPLFLLIVLVWVVLNLRGAATSVLRLLQRERTDPEDLSSMVAAEHLLFVPYESLSRWALQTFSCMGPAIVMGLVVLSDFSDLFVIRASGSPMGDATLFEWASSFDSSLYLPRVFVREAALVGATGCLYVLGLRAMEAGVDIRAMVVFHRMRSGLAHHCLRHAEAALSSAGASPRLLIAGVRTLLVGGTTPRAAHREWRIRHEVRVDAGDMEAGLTWTVDVSLPRLWEVYRDPPFRDEEIADAIDRRFVSYCYELGDRLEDRVALAQRR